MNDAVLVPHVVIVHSANGRSRLYHVPDSHFPLPSPERAYTFGWPSLGNHFSGIEIARLSRVLSGIKGVQKGSISCEGIHLEVHNPAEWKHAGQLITTAILRCMYPHTGTIRMSAYIVYPAERKTHEVIIDRIEISPTETKGISTIEENIDAAMF